MGDWFTVYADSGEYSVQAASLQQALKSFTQAYPNEFPVAIVSDSMRPALVLEET